VQFAAQLASRLLQAMAMSQIAEELRNRTLRYTLRIIRYCRQLPDGWMEREIGKQLLRAGMGVTGNYWSCCRGRSDREFLAKLGVAVDEADESVLWLTLLIQLPISEDLEVKSLLGEGREILAILSKSHKTAKENRRRRKRATGESGIANSPTRQFTKST
jgi:four helix bundle protein